MAAMGSMRQMTTEMNSTACIEAIGNLLGREDLKELPHWSSINNFLETIAPEELESINQKLVYRLIRCRAFENNRYRKKWQILIDGTQLYHFNHRHCAYCLTRTHNKGTSEEHTEYYHAALEAKLLLAPGLLVHIATEFVENPSDKDPESKQDCELKAFYRLIEKIKRVFPHLPICLMMDSLFACAPVFRICRDNRWNFIIRFKEGKIPSVSSEFENILKLQPGNSFQSFANGQKLEYRFVTEISYDDFLLNIAQLSFFKNNCNTQQASFTFLTNFPLKKSQVPSFVAAGRNRWSIENQGFNTQKNHGYFLEHPFSHNYQAMKNHYFLIQIAHLLVQLCILRLQALQIAFPTIAHFRACWFRSLCSAAFVRLPFDSS